MHRKSLADFIKEKGQVEAAEALGVSQGAISKALRSGREIFITCLDDGSLEAEELRPFPAPGSKRNAA